MSAIIIKPEFRALLSDFQLAIIEHKINSLILDAMGKIITAPSAEKPQTAKPFIPAPSVSQRRIRQRISRAIPDGCTAERTATGVEFRNGNQVVQKWEPALLKAITKPRPEKGEKGPKAEITVFPSTVETTVAHSVSEKPAPKPEPVAATAPRAANGLLIAAEVMAEVWPDPASRPSIRWFREMQARRVIPHIKMGHLTFFEADRVRAALRRFEISAK